MSSSRRVGGARGGTTEELGIKGLRTGSYTLTGEEKSEHSRPSELTGIDPSLGEHSLLERKKKISERPQSAVLLKKEGRRASRSCHSCQMVSAHGLLWNGSTSDSTTENRKSRPGGRFTTLITLLFSQTADCIVVCCNHRFTVKEQYCQRVASVSSTSTLQERMLSEHNSTVRVLSVVQPAVLQPKAPRSGARKPEQVRGSVWAFSNLLLVKRSPEGFLLGFVTRQGEEETFVLWFTSKSVGKNSKSTSCDASLGVKPNIL